MTDPNAEKNKAIILKAFNTLFNKRDYTAAERFWSPDYIQHRAHIEPGRDGLFNLVKATPPSLKYEHGLILAENDYVIVHGRFSNIGLPVNAEGWNSRRALGCYSGRSDRGAIEEQSAHVW